MNNEKRALLTARACERARAYTKRAIARWDNADSSPEEIERMVSLERDDLASLLRVYRAFKQGDDVKAARLAYRLDTFVRDRIEDAVYDILVGRNDDDDDV